MKSKLVSPLFYFGTLISSIGSFAFNLSLIAFMLKSGFYLGDATLIIGMQRIVPVIVATFFGHLTDTFSPTKTVVATELIAGFSSILLLSAWHGSDTNYLVLILVCVIRSIVVSFQAGSRSKVSKLLSAGGYAENAKHVIWLNKATQGATLFGGLLGWIIIKYFTFQTAIILDAVTFLINGMIVLSMPTLVASHEDSSRGREKWYQKFQSLFEFNYRATVLDIVLAVSMMGTVAFMSRLASHDQSWAGLFMASFGLAVWVSGFLERTIFARIDSYPFWILLGATFGAIGQFSTPSLMLLILFFIKDLAYWTIFHRISAHIQHDTPTKSIGSVTSARVSIVVSILALGEILVGTWSSTFSIQTDAGFRAFIALASGCFLYLLGLRKGALDERPAL